MRGLGGGRRRRLPGDQRHEAAPGAASAHGMSAPAQPRTAAASGLRLCEAPEPQGAGPGATRPGAGGQAGRWRAGGGQPLGEPADRRQRAGAAGGQASCTAAASKQSCTDGDNTLQAYGRRKMKWSLLTKKKIAILCDLLNGEDSGMERLLSATVQAVDGASDLCNTANREVIKSPKSPFACAKLLTFEAYMQCKPEWFIEAPFPTVLVSGRDYRWIIYYG